MIDLEAVDTHLRKNLTPGRYEHSRRVAETARRLALDHGADPEKAMTAGLVHDIARELPPAEVIRLAEESGCLPTEQEISNPVLLHGRAAARILERDWGLDDREILDAVIDHTVGSIRMGILGKIIFVADFVEPGREYHELVADWDWKGRSINSLLAQTVALIRAHLLETGRQLAPEGEALYEKLKGEGLIP
jgi:nicotinate-nucleotide adenylyltransferase